MQALEAAVLRRTTPDDRAAYIAYTAPYCFLDDPPRRSGYNQGRGNAEFLIRSILGHPDA